jgi:uncharacterized protein (TIGR03067 family)
MTGLLRALVMITAVSCLAAGKKDGEAKTDQEKFQGMWEVISSHDENGQPNAVKDVRFVFTADGMEIRRGKDDPMVVKYTLDPTTKPKQIDLTTDDGGKVHKQLGIYALDGGMLKVRWVASGKPRPSDLEAKDGLFVLKRVEKEAK